MTGGLFGGGSIFFHPEMAIIRLFQTHIKLLTRDFRSTPNHQRKHPHKPPFRPWQALSSASSLGSQPGHSSHRSTPVWMDTWTSFSSLFRPLELQVLTVFWSPEDFFSPSPKRTPHGTKATPPGVLGSRNPNAAPPPFTETLERSTSRRRGPRRGTSNLGD